MTEAKKESHLGTLSGVKVHKSFQDAMASISRECAEQHKRAHAKLLRKDTEASGRRR